MKVEVIISPLEGAEGEELKFNIDDSKASVIFKIDTIEEYAFDRSADIANELIITSRVERENKEETKELMNWLLKPKNVYRNVTVKFGHADEESGTIRIIELNNAFMKDYTESFENGYLKYEAKIAQRKQNMSEIRVR